jgi:hypothetical protein
MIRCDAVVIRAELPEGPLGEEEKRGQRVNRDGFLGSVRIMKSMGGSVHSLRGL